MVGTATRKGHILVDRIYVVVDTVVKSEELAIEEVTLRQQPMMNTNPVF